MKKLLFFLLFTLLICNKLMAYELSCSYKWNDGTRHFFWQIEGDKVITRSTTHKKIIDENIIKKFRNHLYFGQNTIKDEREDRRGFRLSILDKETLKFRVVVIYNPTIEKKTSSIIEGTCDKVN